LTGFGAHVGSRWHGRGFGRGRGAGSDDRQGHRCGDLQRLEGSAAAGERSTSSVSHRNGFSSASPGSALRAGAPGGGTGVGAPSRPARGAGGVRGRSSDPAWAASGAASGLGGSTLRAFGAGGVGRVELVAGGAASAAPTPAGARQKADQSSRAARVIKLSAAASRTPERR